MKKEVPDSKLLVPLLVWASGSESNIENIQRINRKMHTGKHNIYILELVYTNNIKHFLRYPKIAKLDDDNNQYIKDFAKYFDWSSRELYKNLNVVDLDSSKEEISQLFGYDRKMKKSIGIKNNDKKEKPRRPN